MIVADVRGGHEGKLDEKEDYEVILSSSSKEQKEQPQYDSEELKDVCQMLLSSGTSGQFKSLDKLELLNHLTSSLLNFRMNFL